MLRRVAVQVTFTDDTQSSPTALCVLKEEKLCEHRLVFYVSLSFSVLSQQRC